MPNNERGAVKTPDLLPRLRQFCQIHHLLPPSKIIVAVSGGADSLALLFGLLALRDEFGFALHVASFDHGIRGSVSAADVTFVRDIAAAQHLPFTAGKDDIPARSRAWGIGIEAAARRARYAFLASVARAEAAVCIATGHQRDDQAETVLMHIVRGSGLAGLRGMLPQMPLRDLNLPELQVDGITLIRPLLDCSREQIDAYVASLGLIPRVDASNADTAYTRNRLRHDVLPLLEQINPAIRTSLARLAETARNDFDALRGGLPPLQRTGDSISLPMAQFRALHPAHQRLWIRQAAQTLAPEVEIGLDTMHEALRLPDAEPVGGAGTDLGGGLRLRCRASELSVYLPNSFPDDWPWLTPGTTLNLSIPDEVTLPGSNWRLRATVVESTPPAPGPLSAVIPLPAEARVQLRTRNLGDRFAPAGLHGHRQKLSDTLINIKVPAEWRDRLPLLTINDRIGWIMSPGGSRLAYSDIASPQCLCYFEYVPS